LLWHANSDLVMIFIFKGTEVGSTDFFISASGLGGLGLHMMMI
jgi:hypothetical protein